MTTTILHARRSVLRAFLLMTAVTRLGFQAGAQVPQALPGNAETMGMVARMAGDQVELGCQRFILRFAADGKPVSFKVLPEGKELLNTRNPGDGFVVVNRAGEIIPLTRLELTKDGRRLTAKTADGQGVVFRLHLSQTHVGFQVEKLLRFSTVPDLSLAFRMNAGGEVDVVPHNYMASTRRQGEQVEVTWPTLWNVHKGDDPGGFSLFHSRDAADRDDVLLRIWAEEPIVHPKVDGDWTYERAKTWLAAWRAAFIPNRGTIILEAKALADLYEGVKIAEAADVSEIYLMPWIWRGEYWPITKTTAGVNTNIFPKGEEDVKAFADAVKAKGMWLSFHWVSAGIGFQDPVYVGKKPDRRLASWGNGQLAEAVDEKATTLRFTPGPGVFAPFVVSHWSSSTQFAPGLGHFFNYNIIRVEDELIRFDRLEEVDPPSSRDGGTTARQAQPVWTLTGCQRGFGSTVAAAHAAGAESAGLIVPYNQNLLPDNWSTLLTEQASAYAGFINRVGASRVEFDGIEIHHYYGGTGNKLAELIYGELDHPTIANTSSGRVPSAWFEYRFSGMEGARGHGGGAIVRSRMPSQNASSLLMADFGLAKGALLGSQALDLSADDRGFHVEVFRQHGLHEVFLERVKTWRAIAGALTPEQRKQFNLGTFRQPNGRLMQAGNHNEAPHVYVPEDRGGEWALYPVAVLNTGHQDSPWYWGQENGPVEPWRMVKPNEEHLWTNPFPAQPLRFILHVLAATDYANPENYDIQPTADGMTQVGDTRFSDEPDGLRLSIENPRDKEVWNEKELPVMANKYPNDWSSHRPVGMFLEGDGKNEVLVLKFSAWHERDYAVPIDFTGRRYVEIPHGEASYALRKWGWRFGAGKQANYGSIGGLSLGFGYLPAGSEASLKVSGLKALKEIPVPLTDPVIATAQGTLSVKGQVPFDHYLEYQGGGTAILYDANWNKVADLPVQAVNAIVPAKDSPITVKTAQTGPLPWLEVQFLTRGEPIMVAKPGAKGL